MRLGERGNIVLGIFAALGLAGAIGAVATGVIKGPMTGMTNVSQQTLARSDLSSLTASISEYSMKNAAEFDCDADGLVEPLAYKAAGGVPAPAGGGIVPDEIIGTKTDPWKSAYGYCVWDHGTAVKAAECGGAGANRLRGGDTSASAAIAVISAGPDRIFQTSCADWVDDATPTVSKPANSDDIVKWLPYGQFTLPVAGDARLKEMPDEACTAQSIGIMRLEMGVVQSCTDTGWEEVGTSAQADGEFLPTSNAELNETHTSSEIMFTGFLNEKTVTVTGAASLLINGVITAAPAKISSGDRISLRANAAGVPETTLTFTISVSGVQRSWTVRTRDRYPASLSITPNSDTGMDVRGPDVTGYGDVVGFVVRNEGEIATLVLSNAVLSNAGNFEFHSGGSYHGDDCAGKILAPQETCVLDVRPKATAAHDLQTISGTLSVSDGAVSATATPLSGNASGWTCDSPWGGARIASGGNVDVYSTAAPTNCNAACPMINRVCTGDVLAGDNAYQYQSCNPIQNCTYEWVQPAWSACSATCGGGTQTRIVTCLRNDGTTVADGDCETHVGAKPAELQACNQQSCEIVKYIAATTTHVVMQNLFTPAEWSAATPKRVVINSGVTVGSTSAGTPAIRTGTGWGGTLTLDNNGYILGAGGQPNSGAGGTALLANASGLTLRNYGTIYAGGGAGGRGGNGGGGYYYNTIREPPSGDYFGRLWVEGYDTRWPYRAWNGQWEVQWWGVVATGCCSPPTSYVSGAYTYHRGTYRYSDDWEWFGIYRTYQQIAYSSGGAGGNGGRGYGYDGANAGGAGGGAPGANAGWGGTGGTGGGWGAAGATGNTGGAGNNGGGAGGAGGGAAGFSIQNRGWVTISVTGTMAGRT